MRCTLVVDSVSYLLFIIAFEFAITFWVWLVNSFPKVRVETSLFQECILDNALDNDTPNGDNGIKDNDDDQNYINDNNGNNDHNHHHDYNDGDHDKNYHNDNEDQRKMNFKTMHFGEPFV